MPLETKEEYVALRAEMLARFQKVFDTVKLGVAGVLAVVAFQQTRPTAIPADWLLTLLQALILAMGLIALNEFRHIYRIGTYIAVFCEGGQITGWHRMSRKLGNFLGSAAYEKSGDPSVRARHNRPFPFGERWGEDSTVFAWLLFVMAVLSWVSSLFVAQSIGSLLWPNLLVDIFGALLIILIWALSLGMRGYREDTEGMWLKYKDAWRRDFRDPYEPRME
jgi:hypothetical protein